MNTAVLIMGGIFALLLFVALVVAGRDCYYLWKAERAVRRFGR